MTIYKNKSFFLHLTHDALHLMCDISIKTLKEYSGKTFVSILQVTIKEKWKPVTIVKLAQNITYPHKSFV